MLGIRKIFNNKYKLKLLIFLFMQNIKKTYTENDYFTNRNSTYSTVN